MVLAKTFKFTRTEEVWASPSDQGGLIVCNNWTVLRHTVFVVADNRARHVRTQPTRISATGRRCDLIVNHRDQIVEKKGPVVQVLDHVLML